MTISSNLLKITEIRFPSDVCNPPVKHSTSLVLHAANPSQLLAKLQHLCFKLNELGSSDLFLPPLIVQTLISLQKGTIFKSALIWIFHFYVYLSKIQSNSSVFIKQSPAKLSVPFYCICLSLRINRKKTNCLPTISKLLPLFALSQT